MDKATKALHESRQLAKKREQEETHKQMERRQREARDQGYRQGSAQVESLRRMMTHPIAEHLLAQAGRELGRMIAEKAEESGTPASIAIKVAEDVWSYCQKTGAPIEEIIRLEVNHIMERMETEVRVDVPAMTFSTRIDEYQLRAMGPW